MGGVILLLIIGLFIMMHLVLTRRSNEKFSFMVISGVPLAACLLLFMSLEFAGRVLGFGVAALGGGMVLAGVSLGVVGIVLVVNAYRQGEAWVGLLGATILAYSPAALVIALFG